MKIAEDSRTRTWPLKSIEQILEPLLTPEWCCYGNPVLHIFLKYLQNSGIIKDNEYTKVQNMWNNLRSEG